VSVNCQLLPCGDDRRCRSALRSDAARNADRILRAAREVYAAAGPDAAVDAIARRAGVGERTLYRRFPSKGELIRAALDQSIADNLSPALEQARRRANPLQGLTHLIEAAISLGARNTTSWRQPVGQARWPTSPLRSTMPFRR